MTALCPNCGLSIEPDAPVERDGWRITAFGQVWYDNQRVDVPTSTGLILYAIAASPGPIARIAILNRISDSESDNLLSVQLSHARRRLRALNVPVPFATLAGTAKITWLADQD